MNASNTVFFATSYSSFIASSMEKSVAYKSLLILMISRLMLYMKSTPDRSTIIKYELKYPMYASHVSCSLCLMFKRLCRMMWEDLYGSCILCYTPEEMISIFSSNYIQSETSSSSLKYSILFNSACMDSVHCPRKR